MWAHNALTHTYTQNIHARNPSCCDDRVACDLPSMHCGAVDVTLFIGPTLIICLFIGRVCVCVRVGGFMCTFAVVWTIYRCWLCMYIHMGAYFSNCAYYITLHYILGCVLVLYICEHVSCARQASPVQPSTKDWWDGLLISCRGDGWRPHIRDTWGHHGHQTRKWVWPSAETHE